MGSAVPKLADLLRGAHWRALRLAAEDAIAEGRVTGHGVRLLDRWLLGTRDRTTALLSGEEALSFFPASGSRGPISLLVRTIQAIAPEHPDLPALSSALLLHRRAAVPRKAHPAPVLRVSVASSALPSAWHDALRDMRAGVRRGCAAPAPSIVHTIEKRLCQLAFSAQAAGLPVELSVPALEAEVHAMMARGLASSTIGIVLGKLDTFARYTDAPESIRDAIKAEARFHNRQATLAGKHKERFLHQSGLTLEDVARTALTLYEAAPLEVDTSERHLNWIRAALFAFVIARPLRPLDVQRLVIGQHLRRDSEGWALYVLTRKNSYKIAGRLWDICTPYLDGAVLLGADESCLWGMYKRAEGRSLLAERDGSAMHAHWATKQSRRYLGTGIGIMRTLWHDHCAATGEARAVETALAMCGQYDPRTTFHYRTQASARDLLAQGQSLLGAIADGAIGESAGER